jgi:hypothetical protein
MANEQGEKELKTDWPVVEGTTFKTTKTHGRIENLVPTGGSKVLSRNKVLL